MNTIPRSKIRPGLRVKIVQKQDQRSGKLTEGVVRDILTNSPTHWRLIPSFCASVVWASVSCVFTN